MLNETVTCQIKWWRIPGDVLRGMRYTSYSDRKRYDPSPRFTPFP
jgi:hypothetical protein